MKRQAEESSINESMPGAIFESAAGGSGSVSDVQEIPVPRASKSKKGEKGRHRASIACASCRDRRIRVSQ